MITLQTRTSASRSQNFIICFSRSASSIWPCATTTRASGSCSCSHPACRSIVATRLWTQKTWPSRSSSRRTAPSASPSSYGPTYVSTGRPVLGRRVDRRHVADAGERHLQRSRDRRRRHGQHVHVRAHLLQPLLVRHAEPLLLVDDHQPQVLERDVGAQDAVRADHHVDGALRGIGDDLLLVGRRHEAREHRDLHGERRVALAERDEVLLGQERGRHQHRDLLALHHRLERRADRDLRLAEPHVAADQAIHRLGQLHVVLDVLDRGQLIARLVVRERVLQLVLPRRVGPERVALDGHPDAVETDELAGHVLHGALDLGGGFHPIGAAEPVQARRVAAEVARDHADLIARDEQLVALRVLQDQVVALRAGERAVRDAGVPADAVDPMDGEVAGLELVGDRVGAPAREPGRRPRVTPRAEEVLLGGDGHLGGGRDEAVRERRFDGIDLRPPRPRTPARVPANRDRARRRTGGSRERTDRRGVPRARRGSPGRSPSR